LAIGSCHLHGSRQIQIEGILALTGQGGIPGHCRSCTASLSAKERPPPFPISQKAVLRENRISSFVGTRQDQARDARCFLCCLPAWALASQPSRQHQAVKAMTRPRPTSHLGVRAYLRTYVACVESLCLAPFVMHPCLITLKCGVLHHGRCTTRKRTLYTFSSAILHMTLHLRNLPCRERQSVCFYPRAGRACTCNVHFQQPSQRRHSRARVSKAAWTHNQARQAKPAALAHDG
jgi:hypothetical protein